MSVEDTIRIYNEVVAEAQDLLRAKDHDYGESWRDMRISSITDQILVKTKRIQVLEELAMKGEKSKVAEGRESEYRDIINYCIFAIIKLREEMAKQENLRE
ncbi:MAG: DUF1599 domain-containing protein [bacterium]|jgi:hypothetical protein|nr:DUF1599 domain-containing protein [bacterium]